MGFQARIITHTQAPNGREAISMLVTLPQMIEQEFLRHRVFCCSFGSTRAKPMKKQLQEVIDDPFIPLSYGRNGKGMQAKEELDEQAVFMAKSEWLTARHSAIMYADTLGDLKVHKQIAGRLLQPFAWRTGIITATDWMNFFYLRVHPDAQPEIQYFAYLCLCAYLESTPVQLNTGEWHLPFITKDEEENRSSTEIGLVSAARCARNSYNRLPTPEDLAENERGIAHTSEYYTPDWNKDLQTAQDLRNGSGGIGHFSPFEHQLEALGEGDAYTKIGPFRGYRSLRSMIEDVSPEDTFNKDSLRLLRETYEMQNPQRKLING